MVRLRSPSEYREFISKFGDWMENNIPMDPSMIEGMEKHPDRARRVMQRILEDKYGDEVRRLKKAGFDESMARGKAGILKYAAKHWVRNPSFTQKYFPSAYGLNESIEGWEDKLNKISDFEKEQKDALDAGAPSIIKGQRERIKKAKLSSKDEDDLLRKNVEITTRFGGRIQEDLAAQYLPEDVKEEEKELDSFKEEKGDRWFAQPIREMAKAGLSRDSIRKAKIRQISEIYKPVWTAPKSVLKSYGLKDYEIQDIKERGIEAEKKLVEAGVPEFLEMAKERERIKRLLG